jgi:hypothetical protein
VYYLGSPLKETQYLYQDKELYLALDTLKGLAETDIYWDEIGNLMVITIDRDIINLIPENRVANKNGQSFTLAHPLIIKNGKSYLPAGLIQNLYNIKFIENKEANIFCLHNPMKPLLKGKVTVSAKLRNGPSKKEPWLLELRENELITIYNEEKGWFWVETEKGMLGYINKKDVQIYGITRVPSSNG